MSNTSRIIRFRLTDSSRKRNVYNRTRFHLHSVFDITRSIVLADRRFNIIYCSRSFAGVLGSRAGATTPRVSSISIFLFSYVKRARSQTQNNKRVRIKHEHNRVNSGYKHTTLPVSHLSRAHQPPRTSNAKTHATESEAHRIVTRRLYVESVGV